MEFLLPALKVFVSLGIVLVLLLLILPHAGNYLLRYKGISTGSGASFRLVKVQPITRDVYIAELEIKGKTYILGISGKGIDVIYKEDDKESPDSSDT